MFSLTFIPLIYYQKDSNMKKVSEIKFQSNSNRDYHKKAINIKKRKLKFIKL